MRGTEVKTSWIIPVKDRPKLAGKIEYFSSYNKRFDCLCPPSMSKTTKQYAKKQGWNIPKGTLAGFDWETGVISYYVLNGV